MKRIIEKYFNIATVILGVVVIAGVLVLKVFRKPDSAGPPPADVASVATPSETSGAAPTPPSRP